MSRISASRLLSWIVPLGRLAELPDGVFGCHGALSASRAEPARGVAEHVEAALGEPVRVPAPLVAAVALVVRRLPVVLVAAEAVQQHDQRVPAAARRLAGRQRQVGVERRAVEARDLRGADPQRRRTAGSRRPGTRPRRRRRARPRTAARRTAGRGTDFSARRGASLGRSRRLQRRRVPVLAVYRTCEPRPGRPAPADEPLQQGGGEDRPAPALGLGLRARRRRRRRQLGQRDVGRARDAQRVHDVARGEREALAGRRRRERRLVAVERSSTAACTSASGPSVPTAHASRASTIDSAGSVAAAIRPNAVQRFETTRSSSRSSGACGGPGGGPRSAGGRPSSTRAIVPPAMPRSCAGRAARLERAAQRPDRGQQRPPVRRVARPHDARRRREREQRDEVDGVPPRRVDEHVRVRRQHAPQPREVGDRGVREDQRRVRVALGEPHGVLPERRDPAAGVDQHRHAALVRERDELGDRPARPCRNARRAGAA